MIRCHNIRVYGVIRGVLFDLGTHGHKFVWKGMLRSRNGKTIALYHMITPQLTRCIYIYIHSVDKKLMLLCMYLHVVVSKCSV